MKSIYITLVCLWSFFSTPAYSQLTYGAKTGASFTSFSKDNSSLSGNIGLIAGGFADYELTSPVVLHVSLNYHQLRGSLQNAPTAGDGFTMMRTNNYTLHLAELTGMAGYRIPIPNFGTLAPYLIGGGSVGYNFLTINHRTTNYYYPNYSLTGEAKLNATSAFNPLLYSLQGGLRFNFPIDDSMFSAVVLDILYRRNINPIADGYAVSGNQSASSVYSNSLLVSLGFKF